MVRRAAQLAAQRAARGQAIGKRLKNERAAAGKMRAAQLVLEGRAESDDQEAIAELMELKKTGNYIKITGGFRNKEISRTKTGKKQGKIVLYFRLVGSVYWLALYSCSYQCIVTNHNQSLYSY